MLAGRKSTGSYLGLAATLLIVASCGGSPSGPPPGVPAISRLALGFRFTCVAQGRPGTILDVAFDFADSDGDVAGGKVQLTGTLQPSGRSTDFVFDVPSNTVTLAGTNIGTVHVLLCVRFGVDDAVTIAVALLDAANRGSNVLSATVSRPGGAPEVPAGGPAPGVIAAVKIKKAQERRQERRRKAGALPMAVVSPSL